MRRVTGRLPTLVWLTLVWIGLWGDVSWANLLGGLALAVVLLLLLPLPDVPRQGYVRPLAVLRFLAFFLVELVRASLQVVAQVLQPRSHLHQAVLAVPARGASDRLLTIVANAVSLTPGTLTLEIDRATSTLFVHVLHVGEGREGVEQVRRSILRLERLAILAIGSPECLAALDADTGEVTR